MCDILTGRLRVVSRMPIFKLVDTNRRFRCAKPPFALAGSDLGPRLEFMVVDWTTEAGIHGQESQTENI